MPTKKPKSSQVLPSLVSKSRFSRVSALLIATAVAVIGIVILYKSFAAPGTLAPNHTYTDWAWGDAQRSSVNDSIESSLKIETDTTKVHPGIGYFYISAFYFNCKDCTAPNGMGYMGIQTNGEAGSYKGKIAIFSMFGAAISTEAGSAGSSCATYGNGFDGFSNSNGSSCRIPLNWQAGEQYAMLVQLVASDATTYTWQASARNMANGQTQIVGKIKTPIAWSKLQGYLINQTEYYSPGRAECDAPYSKVTFGTPKVNGGATPVSNNSYYGAYNGCNQSNITTVAGGVRHEMGNPSVTGVLPVLPAGGTYISDLNWTSGTIGYGVITKDKSVSNDGSPINLAGKTFTKGIGTHAVSDIRYNLAGQYSKFVSYVNLQYGASGKVTYEVWADGTKLFDSGPMDNLSYTKAINVDVTGKKELKLLVTDGGDSITADWAAWADARLLQVAANQNPTASLIGPTTASPGKTLTFTGSAKDTDNNLNTIELYVSPHFTNSFSLIKTCSFAATGAADCSGSWTPSAAGSYDVVVNAYDAAGAKCSGNPNITYPYYEYLSCGTASLIGVSVTTPPSTPPPPPPPVTTADSVMPTVTIVAPTNNARVSYVAQITAKATDNVGVRKMEIYVDGTLRASSTTGSINYNWISYYAASGSHTIIVRAYDAAGNIGQSTVKVTK